MIERWDGWWPALRTQQCTSAGRRCGALPGRQPTRGRVQHGTCASNRHVIPSRAVSEARKRRGLRLRSRASPSVPHPLASPPPPPIKTHNNKSLRRCHEVPSRHRPRLLPPSPSARDPEAQRPENERRARPCQNPAWFAAAMLANKHHHTYRVGLLNLTHPRQPCAAEAIGPAIS
jgi:hypothetical protein